MSLALGYPLLPVLGVLMDFMQMCWECNMLPIQVPSAPAFPTAHLLPSILVLPHPDGPIHFPFGAVLMLLLQTSAILMDEIELTSSSVLPASLIKKKKKNDPRNVTTEKSAPSNQEDAITLFLLLSSGQLTQKTDKFCEKKHCIAYILSSHC